MIAYDVLKKEMDLRWLKRPSNFDLAKRSGSAALFIGNSPVCEFRRVSLAKLFTREECTR